VSATTLDLDIDAGGSYLSYVTWYDEDAVRVDLTAGGYTAALTIKDAGTLDVLLSLVSGGADPDSRIDLEVDSTQNDDYGEVAPSSTGVITIFINAVDTATLSGLAGVYDLILTPTAGAEHAIKLTKGAVNLDTLITT
jgi:hypothetical protein